MDAPTCFFRYSCGQKFRSTHHRHECHSIFGSFKDFFEMFYFHGGIIGQHMSLKRELFAEV